MELRGAVGRWVLGALLLSCVTLLASAPGAQAVEGTGKITGKVTESAKSGVAKVLVAVLTPGRELIGVGTTSASGEYTVQRLAAGSYRVEFLPERGSVYAPQYYENKLSFGTATPIPVSEGKETSEINAELHVGGKISGTVTDTSAHPLEGIGVFAFSEGGEGFGAFSETKAGGKYTLVGLPTGSYTVEFYPESAGLNFVPQYYDNAPLLHEATAVAVVEGAEKTGIDAELREGGEISGRVTDAYTHKPLAGIYVFAHNVGGAEEGFGGAAETNMNGEYTVVGLGTGTYKVEFETGFAAGIEYITRYYNEQATFAGANPVSVTQGSTTLGIDAALIPKAPVNTAGPTVSGTPAVGQALTCANGSWTGEPKPTFTHTWLRNGNAIAGATASAYVVQPADQGSGLACRVTARNEHGTANVTSNTLTVPPALPPPPPLPSPIIELPSSKLLVSGGSARVPIVCAGATCKGTIELTERIVVKHRRGKRTISKKLTEVLAKGSYSLAAGESATIGVRLTSAGRSALARAKHHRLSARLSVSVSGGETATGPVVLTEPAPEHKHGHK